jgi:hypothetical protein
LQVIADNLGSLPHAKLNFTSASEAPKKQAKKWLKAECPACEYSVRITAKWAKVGLPKCPSDPKHGRLECIMPNDDDAIEADHDQVLH